MPEPAPGQSSNVLKSDNHLPISYRDDYQRGDRSRMSVYPRPMTWICNWCNESSFHYDDIIWWCWLSTAETYNMGYRGASSPNQGSRSHSFALLHSANCYMHCRSPASAQSVTFISRDQNSKFLIWMIGFFSNQQDWHLFSQIAIEIADSIIQDTPLAGLMVLA